jgi:hypothetical protein
VLDFYTIKPIIIITPNIELITELTNVIIDNIKPILPFDENGSFFIAKIANTRPAPPNIYPSSAISQANGMPTAPTTIDAIPIAPPVDVPGVGKVFAEVFDCVGEGVTAHPHPMHTIASSFNSLPHF